jgi:hypothetical protein
VGIEHPILGLITFTIIAFMIVTGVVILSVVGMNIQDYILKTPTTEGYTLCFSFSQDGSYRYNLSVVIANSGRVDLKLEKIYLATDEGMTELRVTSSHTTGTTIIGGANVDYEIILLGFTGETELWAGQRGEVRINMVSDERLFTEGAQYSITAYLTTIGFEAFTIREARFKPGQIQECPPVIPPPPEVPRDIILVSRAALYWDTFDTNPIESGRLREPERTGGCNPGYVGNAYNRSGLVYLQIPTKNQECALLIQGVTLPNVGSIYVAFTALILEEGNIDQPGLFGAILTSDTALTAYYTGGFNKSDDETSDGRIFVRFRDRVVNFDSKSYQDYPVGFDKWYNGTLALSYALPNVPYAIAAYANPTTSVSRILAPHELLTPSMAGISIYKLTSPRWMRVYFDSVLVTVGNRPWIVRVEGLQPGWVVVLRDGSGGVIASGVAVGSVVELDIWGIWIVGNGVIEVLDSSGNLLVSKGFSEILGGDVYRVVG